MTENNLFNRKSYHYDLPKELIAQYPLTDRCSSRLMVVNRNTKTIEHKVFTDIIDYLTTGDVLVLNTTKVIPARIYSRKISGGIVEILRFSKQNENEWLCLVRRGDRLKNGHILIVSPELSAEIITTNSDGSRLIKFFLTPQKNCPQNAQILSIDDLLDKFGHTPLPPYVKREIIESDEETYQTIYAKHKGSVAAPTAGLHFTDELIKKIKEKGVHIAEVVLQVGPGTFKPVDKENILEHKMHSELCELPKETAEIINQARKSGNKIISVGTTTTRTLESFYDGSQLEYGSKLTDIFIYPSKKINTIDALITNFHLPESTLIMLVAAFMGTQTSFQQGLDLTMKAYQEAIKEKYRFYSYGDAMLIL